MTVRVRVTDDVRADVVAMPHGFWGSGMAGGSSLSALTPDGLNDAGGGGDFHDAPVQVYTDGLWIDVTHCASSRLVA